MNISTFFSLISRILVQLDGAHKYIHEVAGSSLSYADYHDKNKNSSEDPL